LNIRLSAALAAIVLPLVVASCGTETRPVFEMGGWVYVSGQGNAELYDRPPNGNNNDTLDDSSGLQGVLACRGIGEYAGYDAQKPVVVVDAAGTATLGGITTAIPSGPDFCGLRWHVEGVPVGQAPYKVTFGDSAPVIYTDTEARAFPRTTLGARR
jgi:hypothetical protein